MDVNIKLLYGGSIAPQYQREGDGAMDVFACIDKPRSIRVGDWATIPLGFAVEVPQGYGLFIVPRSGLAVRHGVNVFNAPGLIDSNYRGEVKAILVNHGKEEFFVYPDARIAQVALIQLPKINWVEVDELSETNRGEAGFGSTGV